MSSKSQYCEKVSVCLFFNEKWGTHICIYIKFTKPFVITLKKSFLSLIYFAAATKNIQHGFYCLNPLNLWECLCKLGTSCTVEVRATDLQNVGIVKARIPRKLCHPAPLLATIHFLEKCRIRGDTESLDQCG